MKSVKNKGLSKTPTYLTWNSMRRRCLLGSQGLRPAYVNIKVCERWLEYANFIEDMGERPEGMTLDRVNVLGDYEPNNCRWSTPSQQQRNKVKSRTITFRGVTKSIHDWAEETGIGAMTLYTRLTKYNWDPAIALTTQPFELNSEKCVNNGKQKDHQCPSCGKIMNAGNMVQHLRSQKNHCK